MRMIFTINNLSVISIINKKGAVKLVYAFIGLTLIIYGAIGKYVFNQTTAHLK